MVCRRAAVTFVWTYLVSCLFTKYVHVMIGWCCPAITLKIPAQLRYYRHSPSVPHSILGVTVQKCCSESYGQLVVASYHLNPCLKCGCIQGLRHKIELRHSGSSRAQCYCSVQASCKSPCARSNRHSAPFPLQDLKPGNLAVNQDCELKVCTLRHFTWKHDTPEVMGMLQPWNNRIQQYITLEKYGEQEMDFVRRKIILI